MAQLSASTVGASADASLSFDTSGVTTLAVELLRSVGVELAIFLVTLCFTLVIRSTAGRRIAGDKVCKAASVDVAKDGNQGGAPLTPPSSPQQKAAGAAPLRRSLRTPPCAPLTSISDKPTMSKMPGTPTMCKMPSTPMTRVPSTPMTRVPSTPMSRVPSTPTSRAGTPYGEQPMRRRLLPSGSFNAGNAETAKALWQMVDEIVDGMREQNNMKFAARALALYEELRGRLAEEQLKLPEVTRQAKYSAIDFFTTLVHCAVRSGRHHMVEALMDDMIAQGVARPLAFYESTMKQLAGQKQYALALAIYDRLAADGLQPSAVTCSCLIGFAAEVGELQRAVNFFEHLSAVTTPTIRAYMTILRVHAKRQDWPASLNILRDMKNRGVPMDSLALNVALATGIAADRLDVVSELVAEADRENPPVSDVVSYNTLAKGYAQRGDVEKALQILDRLKARGLRPNAITFNTCMDAAVRGGRVPDSWRLLKEMRAAGLQPDKFTCSILIKGLARSPTAEGVDNALELLMEVDNACDAALRSTLYHSVLESSVQATAMARKACPVFTDLTAKAFSQMRQQGVTPTAAAQRLIVQALPSSCGVQRS